MSVCTHQLYTEHVHIVTVVCHKFTHRVDTLSCMYLQSEPGREQDGGEQEQPPVEGVCPQEHQSGGRGCGLRW